VDDKKHGPGVFVWADGRKYEGTWVKGTNRSWNVGKQQGLGVYHISDRSVKYGEWQNGVR
jgi:hypothetical protein